MIRRRFVSSAAAFALGTRAAAAFADPQASSGIPQFGTSLRQKLQTRAELTSFAETSTNADVDRFLATLDLRGAPIARGVLGTSARGRPIPYVVASRPLLLDPGAARAAKKPVVFLIANASAAEPAGKEAVLAVLRDLAIATGHTILEDMVLVVVPNLNVDGNAVLQPAAVAAPNLNGPARVGSDRDAAGVRLDADFLAQRSNAVAQLVDLGRTWTPDVVIDLRTRAESLTSFSMTYAPPLHPAAFYAGPYTRDTMLPVIQSQLKDKFGIEAFTAGGFGKNAPMIDPRPGTDLGWYAPPDDLGVATNYFGVRGATALTAFAYPHDTFERRVFYLRAFLTVVLQYCSDKSDDLIARTRLASHWVRGAVPVRTARDPAASGQELISWQRPAPDSSSSQRQPGMPGGFHLDGRFETSLTPVFDRYTGTLYAEQPYGYAVDVARAPAVRSYLARQGITFEIERAGRVVDGEVFRPTGRRADASVIGTWRRERFRIEPGSLFVVGQQAQGPLVSLLLEPESEAGLVTLRLFERGLIAGVAHAVRRVFTG